MDKGEETADMAHDKRILKHEEHIEALRETVPSWVKDLQRPPTPVLIPQFGPLEGIRVISTGIIVAQPYIGTKLAEFGAEVIHVLSLSEADIMKLYDEKVVHRTEPFTAPQVEAVHP